MKNQKLVVDWELYKLRDTMNFLELFTRDRPAALRLLEDSDNKLELVNQTYSNGWSCVHQAVQDGDTHALTKLIEYGSKLWTAYDTDIYPIQIAILFSRYDALCVLLENDKDIPLFVFCRHADNVSGTDNSFRKSFLKSALLTQDERIVKVVVDKFLRYLSAYHINMLVYCAVHLTSLNIIQNIFGENPITLSYLKHSNSLDYALARKDIGVEVIEYILFIGEEGYPYEFATTYRTESVMIKDPDCTILETLIRHPDKVTFKADGTLLYQAVFFLNSKAVDITLALGHDYSNDGGLIEAFYRCHDDKLGNSKMHSILRNMLLFGGIGAETYDKLFRYYDHNNELGPFSTFCRDTISSFYNTVTLFEMLSYTVHIQDLRETLGIKT